jgi:hypothetical protein
MRKSNLNLLIALALSLVIALPALAKKSSDEEYDATDIGECKIETVNRLSEKTEALATNWQGIRGTVRSIPERIGTATGKDNVDSLETAMNEIIALELPVTVDMATMKLDVSRDNLTEEQAKVADELEALSEELKKAPAAIAELPGQTQALITELQNFVPNIASEFQGNPIQAAVEVPKATQILKGQIDYLIALPEEIEATGNDLKAFFEGIAALGAAG